MPPPPFTAVSEPEPAQGRSRDGVCVVAADWTLLYANASFIEILMLRGERSGTTLWELLPEWIDSPQGMALRAAMDEHRSATLYDREGPGEGRIWQIEVVPLQTGELRLVFRNVTERARLEELERRIGEATQTLSEREGRLEAILEGAPVGIVLLDAETFVVQEANATYHTFLEGRWTAPGSIIGRPFAEFIPQFEEQGLGDVFRGVRDRGIAFTTTEQEFQGFDRGPVYFRGTLKPLDLDATGRARSLLLLLVDVTAEIRARRDIEAERAALYEVLNALPAGVLVAEAPSGRTMYLNPLGQEISGRSLTELMAADFKEYVDKWKLFLPSGKPYPAEHLPVARAMQGEYTRDEEITLCLPNGSERTVLASGVPLRDAAGKIDRAVIAFHDVTDRLILERELLARTGEAEHAAGDAALRAEESRALREMGRALVSELEPDRVLRLVAANAMELLGARGSFINSPLPDGMTTLIAPALGSLAAIEGTEFPLAGSVAELSARDARTRIYNSVDEIPESSAIRPRLRELGVRNALFVPMRAFGESLGLLGVVDRDGGFGEEHARLIEAFGDSAALAVSNARRYAGERRRAEENRALLAAAEALTSTLDPAEVMERIVHIAQELTEADGAALSMFVGDEGEQLTVPVAVGIISSFQGLTSSREGTLSDRVARDGTAQLISVDGLASAGTGAGIFERLEITHLAIAPLRAGGESLGTLAVANARHSGGFSDEELRVLSLLADQAALAVRNARTHELAQAANRAKSAFLAMMSHELRTPLNALQGYASLIEDGIYGPVTEGQRNALGRMRTARTHLMSLIEQVLEMARVEAGRKQVDVEEVDLDLLVREVAETLRGSAEEKGLRLESSGDAGPPIVSDPRMIRQILINLLGNAIKFTDSGSVTTAVDRLGGNVRVRITDTGPGIDPAVGERLFEPFYQVDRSNTRKEGGSGLGLALSREFARLLGGDIELQSEPGRGSTFTLVLPPERPKSGGEPAPAA